MASRKDPVSRARGRKPAPVKKPFPWGFAIGALVLALFLGGILAYAATNVSLGDHTSLTYARKQISGLHNDDGLSRNHVDGKFIDYPNVADTPPDGGNHNPNWQSCQVYTTPIAPEHAVHSMEHGAVWITYNPDQIKGTDLDALKKVVGTDPYHMMSPYPGLKTPISLQSWGERLMLSKPSDPRIKKFLKLFTQPSWAPEPGGSCVNYSGDQTAADAAFNGHVSSSGKVEGAAKPGSSPTSTPPAVPTSSATATPSAAPTKK